MIDWESEAEVQPVRKERGQSMIIVAAIVLVVVVGCWIYMFHYVNTII